MGLKRWFGVRSQTCWVKLDEIDLEALLVGGEVNKTGPHGDTVKIVMADIAWDKLDDVVSDAYRKIVKSHRAWYQQESS